MGFHKPHTPYRAPQRFYDLYPEAPDVAEKQSFPEDVSGLGWFECKAEGASYPIAGPFTPYDRKTQQELRRAYYASVSFTDDNIGKLLAALDATGKAAETLVVLHADHGYQLGERNIWCKETNFDLAGHVPLMIRVPGSQAPAARTAELVEIVDMFPTMVEMAGAPPLDIRKKGEPPLGGKSLAGLIQGALNGGGPPDKDAVAFSQYSRRRCYNDLFYVPGKTDPRTGKVSCPLAEGGYFTGFSVRRNDGFNGVAGDGLRYTRWVNVSQDGTPHWDQVVDEEFYLEPAADGDDYDKSEEGGNLARRVPKGYERALDEMRALLKSLHDP